MEDESIVYETLTAIADEKGIDPADLNFSLQNYVDIDALQALVRHSGSVWTLTFEIPDYTVTVTSDRSIIVNGTDDD